MFLYNDSFLPCICSIVLNYDLCPYTSLESPYRGSCKRKNLELVAKGLCKKVKNSPMKLIGAHLPIGKGQGNTLGRTFEELKEIIDGVSDKARIGVTLDTCHLFGGGYDIRTSEKFGEIMKDFDRIVGLKYLKAMHLNDSKCDLDTRKDRHECLDIPLILETPEPDKYKSEIELLFSLIEQK
ncbi:unnamed protein product [Medioppia subpectinata]|uniref:Xylose isomerase-like TIM barrel domain-containing protein n=1 Tax=Medioppia subpectinata TaxID=1979941 RepID=A0A7R9PTU3_9ACAR|nr:unnamed protein product [Medioppia subpectinata]CAG2100494.1 unnamed protein product [Medioppia subpectinata]